MRILESLANLLESAGHSALLFSTAQALLDDDGFTSIDCLYHGHWLAHRRRL
jgi:hypothetical protein